MLGELQLVEKKIKGCNPAVPGNDEISTSVSWRVTRAARDPSDTAAVAQFFGLDDRLISKIRVSSLDRTRDAIDLVAASVGAFLGIIERAIFGKYLVYGRAPTRGVEIQIAPVRSSVHLPVAPLWAHYQGGDVDKGLAELEK